MVILDYDILSMYTSMNYLVSFRKHWGSLSDNIMKIKSPVFPMYIFICNIKKSNKIIHKLFIFQMLCSMAYNLYF